ncbi:metalloregulator ArsR/SmtB family transcription factor [Reinekea thalattae]|uniref:Metalloregulator ArsR/SmtB family transcription factor n=1 Tax=Reinekea thalattae TaxID=2593301 RepID=A0A5C8Z2A0_9GAMM|nr:metalloregulator ArsR/SmtB family transcription factor [Reinekea thalattae]TXR51379.1 metalloregulator ArsR/SmtB family transcription factor [Reinekea thalattae]
MDTLTLYKCLAEETRLKTLLLLHSEGELCVCQFIDALDISQPKISRHLAELRKHQLVIDERRGKWVYYQLNPELGSWVNQLLAMTLQQDPTLISQEQSRLKGSMTTGQC